MMTTRKVILTGATGMVGEGVLHVCLSHPGIETVRVVGRRSCGVVHPKLQEVVLPDVSDLSSVAELFEGYDACFFCLGVSVVGKRNTYYETTYTLTLKFARTVARLNPGLVFCYVSAAGADRTGKSRFQLVRVKGKTEHDLSEIPSLTVYALRPGWIVPMPGMKRTYTFYRYFGWIFPIGMRLFPKVFCRLEEVGLAMVHLCRKGYGKEIVLNRELKKIAHEESKNCGFLRRGNKR